MENNIRSLSVPKAFYTVDDISKLMSVAPNTIYTLVNNGTISSIRVGRQIRVSRPALLQFLGLGETPDD